ncbi:hypothetical protein VTJ04DRAFT_10951 [Mycothermus thermophilus]|jgi:hypothetical protein
MPRR